MEEKAAEYKLQQEQEVTINNKTA
ncbi:hypothetical protein A1E_01150 [Rickettsia canadensis str. McKiel]|uniref:Uncharacterized protein n=1 Tax=Rickettsia canadensis (strain McKiel) TaxID=293613 RepID=A8EXU2_RICCK|nr:hypothetical protein A1E_01150 [Rickettsia canadensis str. McKiel]